MQNLIGFKDIPGFSLYAINRDGAIVSKRTGVLLKPSLNGSGYMQVTVTNDAGKRQGLGIHRALALAFIPAPGGGDALIVNHIDGDKLNNVIDNLEWTTYRGNAEHAGALGLTEKCKPVSIRDAQGNVKEFSSYIKCAEFLGVSKDAIVHRVKSCGNVRWKDGYQYRSGHGGDSWPEPVTRAVAVRCGGKLSIFESKRELAEYLGVSAATISQRLKDPIEKIYKDNTQVGYLSDFSKTRSDRGATHDSSAL